MEFVWRRAQWPPGAPHSHGRRRLARADLLLYLSRITKRKFGSKGLIPRITSMAYSLLFGGKMLKQQLRVGTSSYSWFQLVSVSPRFAQDATYWERFYWEKRPII
jgi:hypothetical protein